MTTSTPTRTPIEIAQALHAAIEAGRFGEELAELFTDDATITEYPDLVKPAGAVMSRGELMAASRAGARLMARQFYDVHHAGQQGSTAILRLTWTGTVGQDIGRFTAGQRLTAHIAQFVTVRGARISALATYDCYEPF